MSRADRGLVRVLPPTASAVLFGALAALVTHCSTPSSGGGTTPAETDASATDGPPRDGAPPSPPKEAGVTRYDFDWVGIVGTGQSLSVGVAAGAPLLSTTQPFQNAKLVDPTGAYDGGGAFALAPLVAPIRPIPVGPSGPYPRNIYGETVNEGMANQISQLSMDTRGHDTTTVHAVVGESGQAMSVIRKGGTGQAYAASMIEATALTALAKRDRKSFGYGAVVLTHGESDSQSTTYEEELTKLWSDYDTDLRAITGQTEPIVMLVTQQSTFPFDATLRPVSTQAVWRASLAHEGKIVCVGPKYQYEYAADRVHMTASGYRRLGEKNAEAFWTVQSGGRWRPLQPTAARRSNDTITIAFDVAFPPLAWDPNLPPPHQTAHPQWANGKGFEVADGTGPLTITSATIDGSSVVLKLATAPTGTGLTVRYAMTQDVAGPAGGLATGRRGLLRDSDPFVGRDAEEITVNVTKGSATVTAAQAGALANRTITDRVSGNGVAPDVTVTARPGAESLQLSQAWGGTSGTARLTFANDQRNYLVHFEMPVE